MNRRQFVRSLGASTFYSGLSFPRESSSKPPGGGTGASSPGRAGPLPGGRDSPTARLWPRPLIVPVPTETAGVAHPTLDLAGTWKFTLSPPPEFWANRVDPASWSEVEVPGELAMQGIQIARDVEYPYKRSLLVPADAAGKRLVLRFEGVYSLARLWVNGVLAAEHHGGFTSWCCDITDHVTPGETAWLTVGVTDRSDDISYESNYAKHFIGGILRGVRLLVLPQDYVARLHVETGFDSNFKDAKLRVTAAAMFHRGQRSALNLRLTDPANKEVPLAPGTIALSAGKPEAVIEIPISSPTKWDAEHPYLYTLGAEVVAEGSVTQKLARQIGFRKVERRMNQLYVNGDAVKLRGACRHDAHPLRGRSTTPELDERDARLLRDANVNFVRTSHYPPPESFLDACDRHGIYVEEEAAVCFVDQSWSVSGPTESAPEFTPRFMNQFAEMIERDRSHPAVILWSLGNESRWGTNFEKEHAYAKQEDPSRPVIFSFPESVPAGVEAYDIYSQHYPPFNGDLTSKSLPKINDEYAHISCYNVETLQRDPGVRNFWGHSIRRFWENCYNAQGCLGGAIWAGIDEVFMLPDSPVGYGEWGIIDGWRRPKPEYWLTRKAYSPVRLAEGHVPNPGSGRPLELLVKNWFNHTNFRELRIRWKVGSEAGGINNLDIAPGAQGILRLPARAWREGDVLNLQFHGHEGLLFDEYDLRIGKRKLTFPGAKGPPPRIVEKAGSITVQGSDFALTFSRRTGQISEGAFRGRTILEGGPILNLGSHTLPPWWPTRIQHSSTPDEAVINLAGAYMARRGEQGRVSVEFEIRVDGQGLITTEYTVHDHLKDASEVGIAYVLPHSIDRLTWDRESPWSAYPSDHIGRPRGTATRSTTHLPETYRREPRGPWSEDSKDFFLYGPDDQGDRGTNDFRSTKENIWYASCVLAGTDLRVRAESDSTAAARLEVRPDGKVAFIVDNLWGYPDLDWGNYLQPVTFQPGYRNTVRMRLTDTDRSA